MSTQVVDILLVEDDPGDAELTIRTLRKQSMDNHLVHINDGQAALDSVFGAPATGMICMPRVILLDLKLPRVDGIEVLRRLKSDPVTRNIPVVILSSSSQGRDMQECYNLGVNSYVVKPLEFERFKKVVSELGNYWLLTNQTCSR
jgi:two-component system, response regulator